jgi:hypothetical protein
MVLSLYFSSNIRSILYGLLSDDCRSPHSLKYSDQVEGINGPMASGDIMLKKLKFMFSELAN